MSGASPLQPGTIDGSRADDETHSVLLVDDTDVIRSLATAVLSEAGFEAHAAEDGAQALGFLHARTKPVDVIITDLTMPQMDGLTLIREVRRLSPATRVVLMTGYFDGEHLAAGCGEQPDLVLSKPFRPPELLQAVEDVLRLQRPAS
jgi:two-component system cell cycle sensor histidine kinase/response regulator CckA